jgi:beta-galactosidase
MRAFNKGIVWVNGKNLGRYWKIGPQQTLYLPGCWLRKGANEIIVREMLEPTGEPTVAFLDHPILDELHPEADFNIVKREHDKFIGGEEVVSGTFPSDGAAQVVMFEKPARGRYFTLQVESSYDAQGLAAIAEFDFLDKDGNPMTSLELSVTGVDSEEEIREDGVAENAIDGQVEAFWLASSRKLPHWIEFCSPVDAEVHGFRCTPRQDRNAGRIREWRFYAR